MRNSRFFVSTRIRNIYFLYLFGLGVIVGTIFFISSIYQQALHQHQNPFQLAERSTILIAAAQSLPASQSKILRRGEMRKGIRVSLSKKPPADATIFNKGELTSVSNFIINNPQHFDLSFPVSGRWITLRHRATSQYFLFYGFLLSVAVLVLFFCGLLYILVRNLSYSLSGIIDSAKRFARDINSPPVALSGPPEFKAAIDAFNKMQGRVRQLVEDRTQMLAAISHDLRTPITRLQLRAEFLPEVQKQKANNDLLEMQQMISSILSFARDYNSSEPQVLIDLNALLDTICDNLADVGSVVSYAAGPRAVVQGRMLALKRAFTNLVDNAVKYGKSAQVSMQLDKQQVVVKIKDQGPGIPEADIEKVFRPFYRVDAARTSGVGGSGLGLAVSRDIIRSNGGDIQLLNLSPHGLQVTVVFSLVGGDDISY